MTSTSAQPQHWTAAFLLPVVAGWVCVTQLKCTAEAAFLLPVVAGWVCVTQLKCTAEAAFLLPVVAGWVCVTQLQCTAEAAFLLPVVAGWVCVTKLQCTAERRLLSAEAVRTSTSSAEMSVLVHQSVQMYCWQRGRGAKHMLKVKTTVLLTTSVENSSVGTLTFHWTR